MRISSTKALATGSEGLHPRERFRQRWQDRSAPALISVHRGLWGPAPENSRKAIALGAALGIVEIDVQMAADGIPVVMHDTSLERMTGDLRNVHDVPSDEITALTLLKGEGGAQAALSSETVPSLIDAIGSAPDGTFFDFDVKHPHEVEAVARFLFDNGLTGHGSLKIDVTSGDDIARLRSWEDRFGIMIMAKPMLRADNLHFIGQLVDAGVAAAEVWFDDLGAVTKACALAGDRLAISTYTLDPVHCCGLADAQALSDPDAVWGKLLAAGITILMTDEARALDTYLASLRA